MISWHGSRRSRARRAAVVTAALVTVLGVVACSPDSAQSPPGSPSGAPTSPAASTPAADALHTFAPAVRRVPAGFREVLCPVRRGAGGLSVRVAVPVLASSLQVSAGGCGFGWGLVAGVSVTLAHGQSLAAYKRKELDPYEDVGGDDEITDLGAVTDVAGFGRHAGRGESLRYRVYNDGLPFWQEIVQSRGIRIGVSLVPKQRDDRSTIAAVARSVAVVHGYRLLCPSWGAVPGHVVSFTPPRVPSTVQREADLCRIYFDGSPSTLQSALLDPDPAPLRQLVRQVRKNPDATRVRLQRGVARLAGRPADRLTWVVVRPKPKDYEPAGTWRIVVLQSASARVRWGQTPQWWRTRRAVFDRFAASVRPER